MVFGLTWFDFAAFIVVALSAIMAFARGLIREMFSIIAFIGAAIAGVFFSPMFQGMVENLTSFRGSPARLAAGIAIFLIVYIAVTVVTSAVAKTVHQSTEIGNFDRAAGLVFGVARGVVIGALLVLFLRNNIDNPTNPGESMPEDIASARTYPIFEGVAVAFETTLPQAQLRARDILEGGSQAESTPIPPVHPQDADTDDQDVE